MAWSVLIILAYRPAKNVAARYAEGTGARPGSATATAISTPSVPHLIVASVETEARGISPITALSPSFVHVCGRSSCPPIPALGERGRPSTFRG